MRPCAVLQCQSSARLRPQTRVRRHELQAFVAERVGKTQRLSDVRLVEALPRSSIGKVLKRELRDEYATLPGASAD